MAGDVVLLDANVCMFGMRARVALAEKGVEYEYKEQGLTNKSSVLLQMNPVHKKIPVLIHNGKSINESLIIVGYIDEVWKGREAPLLPSDPYQRVQAKFCADLIISEVHDVVKRIWGAKVKGHEQAKKELIENLKQFEEFLRDKPCFGGDTFGFVDVALFPFYK